MQGEKLSEDDKGIGQERQWSANGKR